MKNKKLIKEVSNGDETFTRVYSFENFFLQNATDIVTNEFHAYGKCVLITLKNKLYGFMFKATGSDENDISLKCHVYSWPQSGLIHGGSTFYCRAKELSKALEEYVKLVK